MLNYDLPYNLKIVKTFLSVFLFSQLIYCTSMTFVLQLHFVKMKLNLKQKKNAKTTFCVLIIYWTLLLPLIGLQFHLKYVCLYSFPFKTKKKKFPLASSQRRMLTVATRSKYFLLFSFKSPLLLDWMVGVKGVLGRPLTCLESELVALVPLRCQ